MGSRTGRKPPTRWIDDVENDLKTLNIKNWQRVAAYHWNWRKRAVEAAKICNSECTMRYDRALRHTSSEWCLETLRFRFVVTLPPVCSNSWDAQLTVTNDPRYA
ncbi:hypothetical protein TNCV_514731 [Trichonephila clavipes]|nr:hypothetical protein TNCV_514731 [Trichonephila clavipes]